MIARNTAFTYKGEPLDVKTIGRELLAARCEDQRFLAQLEPILEGMRKGGLPEE